MENRSLSVEEALKVVRQYIFDRTRRRINTNTRYIASNQRQKLMLQEAFRIAKEYYNEVRDSKEK